ncbi:MAG: hypothetical protein ABIF12_00465 [bacterium]
MSFKFSKRNAFIFLIFLGLFHSDSYALNIFFKKESNHNKIEPISGRIGKVVENLLIRRGYSPKFARKRAYDIYEASYEYLNERIGLLKDIFNGIGTNDISYGIYKCSGLNSIPEDKNVFIEAIRNDLGLFKQKPWMTNALEFGQKLNKGVAIGASIFIAWGIWTRLINGDTIGTSYAIRSVGVLGGTYAMKKFLNIFK